MLTFFSNAGLFLVPPFISKRAEKVQYLLIQLFRAKSYNSKHLKYGTHCTEHLTNIWSLYLLYSIILVSQVKDQKRRAVKWPGKKRCHLFPFVMLSF